MSGVKLPSEILQKMGAQAGVRLFGKKDIQIVVRDCAKTCENATASAPAMRIIGKAFADAILARYGLKEE